MTCEQVGRKLQSYVDGELVNPQLLERFEDHLANCEECRRIVAARHKLVRMLKAAFGIQRSSSAAVTQSNLM